MTDEIDIDHFRARLLEARKSIEETAESREDASATVKLDQTSVGRLSRMDALQQQAMAKNVNERAAASLQQIDAALRRCDDGSYGYCKNCDELIDPRRLELNPAITRCINCAE
ncbi:MAG: TraR/DksA family transcriptional regulator [Gammaproteobacteria bacterium]